MTFSDHSDSNKNRHAATGNQEENSDIIATDVSNSFTNANLLLETEILDHRLESDSGICSVPFCTADLSRYQCNFLHPKTEQRVCLPCSRFYFKHERDRTEAEMSDKCIKCKIRNKNYSRSITQQSLCRSQKSSLDLMHTRIHGQLCSVPFCTADLSRYQYNFLHPKTKLKACRACSRFYFKHKRDRTEAQMSEKCSKCKIRKKSYNCLITQLPLCKSCYYSQPGAIKKAQPKIVCAPDTNPPVLIDELSKNQDKIGSGSQDSSPEPMSTFLADDSREHPTIESTEDAFDQSDFTDHRSSFPDGTDAPDFQKAHASRSPSGIDLDKEEPIKLPNDNSDSNKNRHAATGNQEENSDVIATDVSNSSTNANLLPEIEISDYRLKSNSEICSVPFCTADLSQYQYNFLHPKTHLKACRPCSQFYFKHKRDRTEARMSDECSKCKIRKKTCYCSITQLPLCRTCSDSQRRAIKKSEPNIVCEPDTNPPVLIDKPSKNLDKIGSGSQDSSSDPMSTFLADDSREHSTIDSTEDVIDHSDFTDHRSSFPDGTDAPDFQKAHASRSPSGIDLDKEEPIKLPNDNSDSNKNRHAATRNQEENSDKIATDLPNSFTNEISGHRLKSNSEICSVPFCTADLSHYQRNFYHLKTHLRVCLPCSRFFNKHNRDCTEAEMSQKCSKCKIRKKTCYCSVTQLPLCKSCYYSQQSAVCAPDTNPPVLIDEPSKNHETIGSGSQEPSLYPMSPFLTNFSRIFPTIDSIEDFFDQSDFYDHSSHNDVSGSNKDRYAATGNQEDNSDIIATDVSNSFTNAILLPETEILDHRLKSNSDICSVPFCTADLSRYQRKFYHLKTHLRVCLPCSRFFNKHNRDRTEAEMSQKCKRIHSEQVSKQVNFKSHFNSAAPQLGSDVCEAPVQKPRNTLFKKEKPIRRLRQIHDDDDIDSD